MGALGGRYSVPRVSPATPLEQRHVNVIESATRSRSARRLAPGDRIGGVSEGQILSLQVAVQFAPSGSCLSIAAVALARRPRRPSARLTPAGSAVREWCQ